MKKIFTTLLASTMLVGVAGQANATAYGAAEEIRDTLTDVYSGLGGTFSTDDAGVEYAELLYRIDNLGTVTGVTLSLVDGTLTASGGTSTGLFSVNQVIAQVDTFVSDLNVDMFGSGNDVDDQDASVETNSGLAGEQLNKIVDAVTAVNAILNDVDSTGAERNAAIAWFYDGTGTAPTDFAGASWSGFGATDGTSGEADKFNNATEALANIADDATAIKAITDGSYGGYAVGGTAGAASASAGTAAIPHESATNKHYNSYTDYVAGNWELNTNWFVLSNGSHSSGEIQYTGALAVTFHSNGTQVSAAGGRWIQLQATNGEFSARNGSGVVKNNLTWQQAMDHMNT